MRLLLALVVVVAAAAFFVPAEPAEADFAYCGHSTKIYGTSPISRARYLSWTTVGGDHMHKYAHDKQKPSGGWYLAHTYWRECNSVV